MVVGLGVVLVAGVLLIGQSVTVLKCILPEIKVVVVVGDAFGVAMKLINREIDKLVTISHK